VYEFSIRHNKPRELLRLLVGHAGWEITGKINDHGETVLMQCINCNRENCAYACLKDPDIGALINMRDTSGRRNTALHRAAKKGWFEFVCALVKIGASTTILDAHNLDAAQFAQNHGHTHIAKFLRGHWLRVAWSPQIHAATPIAFQREVWHWMGCRFAAECSKDIRSLIFEALLASHRAEYQRGPR
jgi:ankyrin repeat protein